MLASALATTQHGESNIRQQMWGLAMGCMCSFCYADVPRGEARIRSVAFRQVVYCRSCWDERNAPVDVPMPRRSADELAEAGGY